MGTKLLVIIFLAVGCGGDVSISSSKMKEGAEQNSLNYGQANSTGMLTRGVPDRVTANNQPYVVSIYSSHAALEFIASKPLNTQMQVKFKAKIKNNELVIETISEVL